MPTEVFGNNAATTVAASKSAVAAGTTETWTVGSTTNFPAASFTASPATQFAIVDPAAQSEIIRVINTAGTTWTVIRGVEGTTPVVHSAGATFAQVVTDNALRQIADSNAVAFRRWSAALADVASNPADVLCIGDSITEGSKSTTIGGRWVDQMRDQLRALAPVPGVGGGQSYLPVRYVETSLPAPMATSGTPTAGGAGLGARSYDLTTTTPVVTATVTGTSVRIFYIRASNTGVGSYSIDGATAVNFTTSTGAGAGLDDLAYTTVTFATRGTHTVAVKWVSGGTVFFEGLAVFDDDETKGVRLWESGYYGASSSDIVSKIGDGNYNFRDRITVIQPALVILQFGTNDANVAAGNLSVATYKANMLTIISNIKAACTITPSIVLMAMYRVDVTFVEPWGNYVQVLYDIAAADPSCCVLDMTGRFPPVSGDVLGLYADSNHPSAKGQISIGSIVSNFITQDERVASTLRRIASRLTAAATRSVTAYDGVGLAVLLQPNTAYTFRGFGQYRSAATATGIGIRVNGVSPMVITAIRYSVTIWGSATSASTPVVVQASANQAANLTTTTLAANTDYRWEVEGVIRVGSTGGTLEIEFASETTTTVTIQPESVFYADAS